MVVLDACTSSILEEMYTLWRIEWIYTDGLLSGGGDVLCWMFFIPVCKGTGCARQYLLMRRSATEVSDGYLL